MQFVVTYQNNDGELVRQVVSPEQFVYDAQSKFYKVNFSGLDATDMRTVVTARMENEQGQVMSNTRTYSIESYACSALGKDVTSPIMKELLVAMMKYGDATVAYFSGT